LPYIRPPPNKNSQTTRSLANILARSHRHEIRSCTSTCHRPMRRHGTCQTRSCWKRQIICKNVRWI